MKKHVYDHGLCRQITLQTPLHDVLFQLLVLISSILAPLQLDGEIHITWGSILLPVILGFIFMIARLMALLYHRHGRFDRYSHLEKGTLFMSLGQKSKSQIRWIIAIAMTILSLIFFIIYLEEGTETTPIYIPLIPAIFVSILIIEASLLSDGVTADFLKLYIMFGAVCALISLILLSLKWSNVNMMNGWYIIHLPCFIFYFVSFILISMCLHESGFHYILYYHEEQFQKILWIQGTFSLFTFHFLLILKLDVITHLMKFCYCFIPLWIWELSNFPIVGRLFASRFIWWYRNTLPILTISPSKRRELELQKYMPLPVHENLLLV